MTGIFVDTSGWYAALDDAEPAHDQVKAAFRSSRARLTTSNFVVDETVTLLRHRLGWAIARQFGDAIRAGQVAIQERVRARDEDEAWTIFVRYRDHAFSFTDCTSFALMGRLRLPTAISFDQHFRSYGLHCLP